MTQEDGDLYRPIPTGGISVTGSSRQPVPDFIKELLKDCLHLCLRCLKTILNNQVNCFSSLIAVDHRLVVKGRSNILWYCVSLHFASCTPVTRKLSYNSVRLFDRDDRL